MDIFNKRKKPLYETQTVSPFVILTVFMSLQAQIRSSTIVDGQYDPTEIQCSWDKSCHDQNHRHKTLPAVWETALMKLKGSTEQPFQNRNLFVFLLTATASYRCCHDVTHTHTEMRGGFSQCKWITGLNCCIFEHRKGLRWSSIFCPPPTHTHFNLPESGS